MFQVLRNAWKITDLRKKILYTLFIILIFRIGSAITIPFIDAAAIANAVNSSNTGFEFLTLMSGGGFSNGSIFALSITPYINASIIIQLLTVAIPPLERMAKDGEAGRKKLGQITRYTTVILGLMLGVAYYFMVKNKYNALSADAKSGFGLWFGAIVIVLCFTAGSALMMWLGEQINEKGIGNGISILLFAGIISRIPTGAKALWTWFYDGGIKMLNTSGSAAVKNVILVPIVLVVSLLLAILINKKAGRLTKGYRVALFLPSITSTVAVSMVWLWIFNPDMGILNNILTAIGLNDVPLWLGDPAWSKPALVIMRVWQMSGYYMLMFLAGLQTIPETLYEAADVDGATGWQKFIRITVPMLSNTTFVVAILLVIEAFNMFESIFVMTKGGPLGSTSTIMYYIYEQGFTNYNMGYASALAWIFFALIMIVTLVQYRFRHEQGGE